ncbi:AAA family ATPase [Streptomyces cavernicola]|uniref:AAA family ATPase n=1 Tax=Streptomyces cavernicola TaxID=3043613 RepID=A0ABT6S981_9ACTN|nr:AAA family ATPase [Streptomyces sp. B-S-A6]MDI3404673.1 AAA family ATPase [Streptomyces sp. B-S-A6]
MIVWINGAFGSGKTTLVGHLRRRLPGALVFDPEDVGQVLSRIVDVPTGDFQDLPLWRRQVAELALGLVAEYERPLLVPMTLVDPGYTAEIFGAFDRAGVALHHFFLRVPPAELERRIEQRTVAPGDPERDAAAKRWCRARIEPCTAAVATLPARTVLLDGLLPRQRLADAVLDRLADRVPA